MSEECIFIACGPRWQLSLRPFLNQNHYQMHQIQCDHAAMSASVGVVGNLQVLTEVGQSQLECSGMPLLKFGL